MPTEEAAPPTATAPPPAATPTPPPTATVPDPAVVDLMGADLAETYPALRELEAASAQGLKFPIEKKWLDEQMKDSRFKSVIHNLRGLATKEREATVSEQKAIAAERAEIARERQAVAEERKQIAGEFAKLNDLIGKLPTMPATPAGGVPDPKNPDPKAQQWHAQKYVAELFEPLRKHAADATQAEATRQAQMDEAARTASNQEFILKTPDYPTYHGEVLKLLANKEVRTVEAAYHVVKARALAATPAASPATVAAAVSNGPDLSKMTAQDVAIYALDHPEWKRPADWRSKVRQPDAA